MTSQLKVSVGQFSDRGRKELNQDFHGLCIPDDSQLHLKGIAVAMADGISTSDVSHIASATSVNSFLQDYFYVEDSTYVWGSSVQGVSGDPIGDGISFSSSGMVLLINCSIGEPLMHPQFEQILDYVNHSGSDEYLSISLKDEWSPEDKDFMLSFFFSANWEKFIQPHPAYEHTPYRIFLCSEL